jgi:hypothetical protein
MTARRLVVFGAGHTVSAGDGRAVVMRSLCGQTVRRRRSEPPCFLQHVYTRQAPRHPDRQALTGVFVDDIEQARVAVTKASADYEGVLSALRQSLAELDYAMGSRFVTLLGAHKKERVGRRRHTVCTPTSVSGSAPA